MYDAVVTLDRLRESNIDVASIACDVDVFSSATIERYINEASGTRTDEERLLVVSLERCFYFDSSGISMLVRLQERRSGVLAVVAPKGSRARRVLELMRAHVRLEVRDTLAAACDCAPRLAGTCTS